MFDYRRSWSPRELFFRIKRPKKKRGFLDEWIMIAWVAYTMVNLVILPIQWKLVDECFGFTPVFFFPFCKTACHALSFYICLVMFLYVKRGLIDWCVPIQFFVVSQWPESLVKLYAIIDIVSDKFSSRVSNLRVAVNPAFTEAVKPEQWTLKIFTNLSSARFRDVVISFPNWVVRLPAVINQSINQSTNVQLY